MAWLKFKRNLNDVWLGRQPPGAGADSPLGTKFWGQQKGLITLPKFQEISLKSDFIQSWFKNMYIAPRQGGKQPLGDKVLMLTETSCHFVHLLLFSNHRWQQFLKNPLFYVFPIQSIRDPIWPCCKIGQVQPRVIIWTNLVVLKHPMLHNKFQDHRPFGSWDDFFKFFTTYGHGGNLGRETRTIWTIFRSPIPWRLHMKFGFNFQFGPVVSEKLFNECGRWTDRWQTTEAYLSYKLTKNSSTSDNLHTVQIRETVIFQVLRSEFKPGQDLGL